MAVSTCVKCGGHGLEIAPLTPIGQQHKLTIIQCSNCGTPVGVLDPTIESLKNQIASIDDRLTQIAKALTA